MFDYKTPTAQMLGRWQPWHAGHTELFRSALDKVGQVCIMCRDVCGADAGMGNTDNPFDFHVVRNNIEKALEKEGFTYGEEYIIIKVPNIVDISYGRSVGYSFTQHDLGAFIHDISATKIRQRMREDGEL